MYFVSINSTSEEVRRNALIEETKADIVFPLIQLPKKSEENTDSILAVAYYQVSINSTSEEVRSTLS